MRTLIFLFAAVPLCAEPDDPSEKAQRARELVIAGKAEEAIPIYQELARAFPRDAGMWVNLSVAEFKARRYADAAEHAEAAVRLEPDSLAGNLFLGSSYLELGRYLLAVAPLEKVVAAQPNERNARVMLAEALLSTDRYEDAAIQFQKARDLAPQNPKVWYGLGRSFDALRDRTLEKLETAGPESPFWHALVADAYLNQRRYGSAFAHYRQALAEPSIVRELHAGLAAVYRETGHAAWAHTEEERERQAAPRDCTTGALACDFMAGRYNAIVTATHSAASPEPLYWRYKAYGELARQAYQHLAESPSSLESHLYAAKTFAAVGRDRDAVREWREALKLAPGDAQVQTGLAWSLYRTRDLDAALPLVRELLDKRHDSRELNFLYGASLLNLEEPEKAIPFLETAVRLDGQFLPAQAALGQALLLKGRASQAIPHLRAALAGDADASAHFQLLRAYQLTGQAELARQAEAAYQQARRSAEEKMRMEEAGGITQP